MNQAERRIFLIQALLAEDPQYRGITVPGTAQEQKNLLRSLFNIRPPVAASKEFLAVQDAYLRDAIAEKGITTLDELTPVKEGLYLWQGDITTLACDAIVNAANSQLLGCFHPLHSCIDNAIHTFAGVQLRLACAQLMRKQGREEPTGCAKLTPAFNLPSRYVLHTVGPVIGAKVSDRDKALLVSCYRACLETAEQNGIESVAFCCISTGEFRFPNRLAAEIAIKTVLGYKKEHSSEIKVIFNVFKEQDLAIYRELLA